LKSSKEERLEDLIGYIYLLFLIGLLAAFYVIESWAIKVGLVVFSFFIMAGVNALRRSKSTGARLPITEAVITGVLASICSGAG
jgi:hypothetical protein